MEDIIAVILAAISGLSLTVYFMSRKTINKNKQKSKGDNSPNINIVKNRED